MLHRLSLSSARLLAPSDTLAVHLGNAWAAVAQDAVSGHDVNVACLKNVFQRLVHLRTRRTSAYA